MAHDARSHDTVWDIAVVGAGPAGLAAAVTAAEAGARTLVIDANPHVGGQIWRPKVHRAHADASAWIDRAEAAEISLLQGATVFDARDPGHLRAIDSRQRVHEVSANAIIVATGAQERFLPFPGWTMPGVVGVGALQALIKGGLPLRDQRVVFAGSGPLLLAVAAMAREAGAEVRCIVEQADKRKLVGLGLGLASQLTRLGQLARLESGLRGVDRFYGSWVREAHSSDGGERLGSVRVRCGARDLDFGCDWLACAYGLIPDLRLPRLLGCRCDGERVIVDDQQRTSLESVYCAGESTGIGGAPLAVLEGRIAGHCATGQEPRARRLFKDREREHKFAKRLSGAFALRDELRTLPTPETIVCRCEGVRWANLAEQPDLASAKMQARCGMGECQGRSCVPALRFLRGWSDDGVRAPLFPVPLSALASEPDRTHSNPASNPEERPS